MLVTMILLLLPVIAHAAGEPTHWTIDSSAAARGFEFGDPSGIFILALPRNALKSAAILGMSEAELKSERSSKEWIVDAAYEYQFSQESEVVLEKPLQLIFRYPDEDPKLKTILLWDTARKKWKVLPSRMRGYENEVIASLEMSRAVVAVASHRTRLYEGEASWYPDRLTPKHPFGVASNVYPIGTKLRVISQDTNAAIIVTVISRGPYHNGRIIDLTKTAFSKLAHPTKQGVVNVRVEPLGPVEKLKFQSPKVNSNPKFQ